MKAKEIKEKKAEKFYGIWGNEDGIVEKDDIYIHYCGCAIAKYIIQISREDSQELSNSIETASNHSAILPLEV